MCGYGHEYTLTVKTKSNTLTYTYDKWPHVLNHMKVFIRKPHIKLNKVYRTKYATFSITRRCFEPYLWPEYNPDAKRD